MKPKKQFLVTAILLTAGLQLFAQKEAATDTTLIIRDRKAQPHYAANEEGNKQRNYNYIKLNLTGLALKNYSLQLERTLGRKFSAAIAFRVMPNTAIPFRSQISKSLGENNTDTRDLIDNLELSNFAITPEFRMYLSKKGYGRGFYIAPFYRFTSFKTNSLRVNFTGENGAENNLNLSGTLNTNTAGILFGAQWALGKHLCIDWWIAGPHYGAGKGTFNGISIKPLTQREQDELYNQINNLDIPFADKSVHVNAHGATMNLDGPWGGVRAGLSLGVKF
ncbi:MAG: hypothetical protein JWQ09_1492 [Segetibacter sp.]|nr:hypothetical protein [Segetibacter sp.]